jgi:hypothetical protein
MSRPLFVIAAVAALVFAEAAWARDPHAPTQRHTKADTALAGSIALKRSDLGAGWKQDPAKPDTFVCKGEPDESRLIQTGKVERSFTWRDGVTNLLTQVDIFKTAADTKEDWRLSASAHLQSDCALQAFRSGMPKGVTVRIVSAKELAPPKIADRSLRYRITFEVHGKSTVRAYIDLFIFGQGRISVVFATFTTGKPLPLSAAQPLLDVLTARLPGAGAA